ncbi:S8 family serine peptidase, partial [Allosphingosinicella sp.]|uniref:S8 family serine peptidase n=1 Tax=Allosphingosinicella sp. TaxID=2823234 RepID=UPI002EE5B5FD
NWDGHGTACAGLAAAVAHGTGGVQGSGRGCSLLAVRIAYSETVGGPWQTSNAIIASAIDWARTSGAAIISNSWGGGLASNAIVAAIDRARGQGRGGLGCVVVVAAGNVFGPVEFPANLPGVLAVAASNEYDQAKTPDSADGETWWGSCFGPEIDIAAPGVHNLTTDISGSGGYAAGNYAPAFNGTSSATPIVAGACGLILSKRPNLEEGQVRALITATADKVGQFPYVGGRNDHMGAGRLNVLEAVRNA